MKLDRFKFRAWHISTKQMFDVYCFTDKEVFADTEDGIGTSPINPAKREGCILMQCTGIKDKNGKLIYEGDILLYTDEDGVCYTGALLSDRNYVLRFANFRPNEDFDLLWSGMVDEIYLYHKGTLEVIGNIHEEKMRNKWENER